jgi:apolipoprotein N-acyltransferase
LLPLFYFELNNKTLNKEIVIEINQLVNPVNSLNKKNIEAKIKNLINQSKSDYIFFAENNFPYIINKKNLSNLNTLIKEDKKVIIGATTIENGYYYNSFFLLEKNKIQNFDKKILVPFGEFLPFRKYLNFMEIISGSTDYQKGNSERMIITTDDLKILPIICYEIVFDKIFKNINKKEIDILINITNDSWFGTKSGPYQHFYISRIKALVANKSLLRVSNNGISAIINNNGKIIKTTKLNKITQLKYKLKTNNNKSFFPLHKIFMFYLFTIFIFLIIYSKRKEI